MRIGNKFLRTNSDSLNFGNRSGKQNSGWGSVPTIGGNLDQARFSSVFIFSIIIFVLIFLAIFERYGILRALPAATGAWLSTMVAFRWVWSGRYEWEQYFISLRPIFQTISFMYVVLGPLPPLLGLPQYSFNRGVMHLYWVLYLASPLAFLAYEYGYELGLGKLRNKIRLYNIKTMINFNSSLMVVTFAINCYIYYYMSQYVGFSESGFGRGFTEEHGELIKALGFIFNGLAAATILFAFNNFIKGGIYNKVSSISVLVIINIFLIFMHNRRVIIILVIICLSLIQLIWKTSYLKTIIYGMGLIVAVYFVTTVIRTTMPSTYDSAGESFSDKLAFSTETLTSDRTGDVFQRRFKVDLGYRLDAFDESAAILNSHEEMGIPYMWGEEFLMGAYQAVPKIFAPFPKRDPEEYIIDHFQLEDFDQISNLFSTPIADAGILGIPIAFMLFGLVHACLWRDWANRKITGLMAWGTKCSYFAVMPYLLQYEEYTGSYIIVNMRYWLIYTIIFSLLYGFYTLISQKDIVKKRIL